MPWFGRPLPSSLLKLIWILMYWPSVQTTMMLEQRQLQYESPSANLHLTRWLASAWSPGGGEQEELIDCAGPITGLTHVPELSADLFGPFLPLTQENKQKMARNGTFFPVRKPGCTKIWIFPSEIGKRAEHCFNSTALAEGAQ